MAEKNNLYQKIQELLGEFSGNLTILEQQINADVQLEYFHCAEAMNSDLDPDEILRLKDDLFIPGLTVAQKKKLLLQLASIDRVEAFRTLEKFVKTGEYGLMEWATLALQENRLLMESRILDENQILISTGLGGKGLKIRYFTVLFTSTGRNYSEFEQKLLQSELHFFLKKCGGEIEVIRFDKELCLITTVIPLSVGVHGLFDNLIEECNQYDDFVNSQYMITNVKILSANQIRKMIRQNRIQKSPEE